MAGFWLSIKLIEEHNNYFLRKKILFSIKLFYILELRKKKVKEYHQLITKERKKEISKKINYEDLWNLCDLSKYAPEY